MPVELYLIDVFIIVWKNVLRFDVVKVYFRQNAREWGPQRMPSFQI